MSFQITSHPTEDYRISTDVYEGPLDLLLDLIQRAELDITKLALAQVTDQYLDYLHHLTDRDAGQVSAFLVIAAKLLQIKSEALLPRPVEREVGEEDPGEALAQQLITYRMYKQVAEWLSQQDQAHRHTYLRISAPPPIAGKFSINDITLSDLMYAAREVYQLQLIDSPLGDVIAIPRVTIREKIQLVLNQLHRNSQTTFHDLLVHKHSRLEVVVTFLAVLELIKRNVILAQQDGLFSRIGIQLLEDWSPAEELDLEFEE